MPKSNAIRRPDLGAIAFEYSVNAAQMGFIASLVLPLFETQLQTAHYPVIPAEALLEVVDTKRAPRGAYARGDWEFGDATYNCQENGYEEAVDDVEASLYRVYFDAEQVATMRAMLQVLRSKEVRAAAKVFNTATFAHTAVSAAWNNYAAADPLKDVNAIKREMRLTTGLRPNALICDESVLQHVSMCDAVMDRVKYTDPNAIRGELTYAQLCAYFGVEKILAAGAVRNTAPKKKAKNVDFIWTPTAVMLARISSGGQDLREPALGRTFSWVEDAPGELVVEEYREEQTRSSIYRARQYTDECIQFAGAGHILTGVTA